MSNYQDEMEKRRRNRERIAKKENISGYVEREKALRGWAESRPLPKEWLGVLPEIHDEELYMLLDDELDT